MILIDSAKPEICIDAGHGGHDSGACSPEGLREAEIVLKTAVELVYQLEQLGLDGYLTRSSDEYMRLSERVERSEGATCFVSLHCNGYSDYRVHGIETVYGAPGKGNKAFANYIQQALMKYYGKGHRNRGLKMSPSKEYPRSLYVLRMAKVPACLVELEFITNPDQARWMNTEEAQRSMAYALAQGILSYLHSMPNGECVAPEKMDNNIAELFEEDIKSKKS
jgi:N-acetylmuramoyl-L-alanine amidase